MSVHGVSWIGLLDLGSGVVGDRLVAEDELDWGALVGVFEMLLTVNDLFGLTVKVKSIITPIIAEIGGGRIFWS